MNQRPIKSGYLRQQLILGMWRTSYYYLEGTHFLIFQDDKTHTPDDIIDLSGCIVDGVWPDDGFYYFSLRNIKSEQLYQLAALTYDDSFEWVQKLKQAIILAEYETLLNDPTHRVQIQNDNYVPVVEINQDQIIPKPIQDQLEYYQTLNKDQWIVLKVYNNMKLLTLQNKDYIIMKGEYLFKNDFAKIVNAITHQDLSLELFKYKQDVFDQDYVMTWQFPRGGKIIQFQSKFKKHFIQRKSYLLYIKEHQKFKSNHISLNKRLDIIHVVQDEANTYCNYVQVISRDRNEKIIAKFIKEQLISFATLQNDIDLIVYNPTPLVSQRSSRIMTEEKFIQIDVTEENQHFQINDRVGYFEIQDKSHISYKYKEKHQRKEFLDNDQYQRLVELKQRIGHWQLNDNCLIRVLIARNYKVVDAEQMLQKTLEWRKVNNINLRIMTNYPKFIEMDVHLYIGHSKWGHPVLYTNAKCSNPSLFGKVEGITEKLYLEFHQAFVEESIRKMQGIVDQGLVIIDCYQLSRKNFQFNVTRDSFLDVFNHHPERQYKIYVINSDILTRTIYALLKPFLPARTVEKIVFVGSDFALIKNALLNDLDISVIPQRYGGENNLII